MRQADFRSKVAVLLLCLGIVVGHELCSYLPEAQAPVIEYELPLSALSHPTRDLPLEFHGVTPIVTRRAPLKPGSKPKITVVRYSAAPEIRYDATTNTVVFTSATCAEETNGVDPTSESVDTPVDTTGGSSATALVARSMNWMAMGAMTTSMLFAGGAGIGSAGKHPKAATTLALFTAVSAVLLANHASPVAAETADDCSPVVQVIVEAPSAYRGAVETCLDEINDPAICPDPFPTYPTCDDPAPTCKVAIVGAGAGGLYSALRMVDTNTVDAKDICVFEMTERVGGRLFSLRGLGPEDDLSVDAGGYRSWPRFTPILHALITEYLGIPMECYDDSEPCEVFNIINADGKKDGFATFVEEMMKRLTDRGACFYPYHELESVTKKSTSVQPSAGVGTATTELVFANGVVATVTDSTILNVPQRPLLSIIRNSHYMNGGTDLLDAPTYDALHAVQTVIATKLYLYYPRGSVFWRKLGLVSGDFTLDGDARSMLLAGRYHDGHIECDDDNDPNTCHGFLLAVYANDLSGNRAQYFRRFQRERPEPVTIITHDDLEGSAFLNHAHNRVREFHLYNPPIDSETSQPLYSGFEASQVFQQTAVPTFAVLSTWNVAIPWAGGAWHSWTDLDSIERAQQPFDEEDRIFVVNEAYSLLQGWAEGSLMIADDVLEQSFSIPRPWDFEQVRLNQVVRQTNSAECVAAESGGGGGGGGGGSDGGDDSGGGGSAVNCFTGDALVEMADGSHKPLSSVKAGDFVATGVGGRGKGLVTEALTHAVNAEIEVAVIETSSASSNLKGSSQQPLIGTADHPILVGDADNMKWMEIGDYHEKVAMENGEDNKLKISRERRFIDVLYNLEVDGNILDGELASHSYVVNGVTASGLGDHEELNLRYPRQNAFKEKVTTKVSMVE